VYSRRITTFLILFPALLLIAACQRAPEDIRIGITPYLSGDFVEDSGKPTLNAAQLAVDQVNANGGLIVDGRAHKVALVVEGITDSPESAVAGVQKLINQEDVIAIIGPQFSRDAIPAGEYAEKNRVPLISPMSTNPATTLDKRYVFRAGFVDDFQGEALARFAVDELGLHKAAVLFDISNNYNRGLAAAFHTAFLHYGGEIATYENYTSDQNQDFSGQLERIRESGADVLFLPNYTDESRLQAQQARQAGITATILGGDGWNPNVVASDPAFEGAYQSLHWHPDLDTEESRAFVSAYQQAYGDLPINDAALTVDALGLLFQAIEYANSYDPEDVDAALYAMGPYQGVSGQIDYLDNGDPVKSIVIIKYHNSSTFVYKLLQP
jgi:branched-chain amino acid transport system substrate-binding protein